MKLLCREQRVSIEEVLDLQHSIGEFIADVADDKSTSPDARHALIAKAWEHISVLPGQKTNEFYRRRAYAVMDREAMLFKYGEKAP